MVSLSSTDSFRRIRERVSSREAAEYYGLKVDSKGWALCPWHADKHPSMSFRGPRWRCWVCNISGDAIDLVQRLYGLSPVQAAQRINQDLHLGLALECKQTPEQQAEARRAAEEREQKRALQRQYEAWRTKTLDDLTSLIRIANAADWGNLSNQEAAAVRDAVRLEYICDLLLHGAPQDQQYLFRHREDVRLLTSKILHIRH